MDQLLGRGVQAAKLTRPFSLVTFFWALQKKETPPGGQ
jgi:hypothetical protein